MRARRLLLALALVTAACSGDDDPAVGSSGTTTTTVAGQPPGAGDDTDARTPGSSPDAAPTATTELELAAPETSGPPGSAAPFYLRPEPATSIVVEISADDGAAPRAGTIEHLRSVLEAVSAKPVTVVEVAAPSSRDTWSSDDLRDAADAVAVTPQGDRAVLRMLFVHGAFAESETVLGVAMRADAVAIFADNVRNASSPLVGSGAIEAAVVVHEVGHVLGLVDIYRDPSSRAQRRDDPEHPGHSTNRRSVMYWAVESSLVADILTGGPPRDFDEADLADLAAIRAGA